MDKPKLWYRYYSDYCRFRFLLVVEGSPVVRVLPSDTEALDLDLFTLKQRRDQVIDLAASAIIDGC